MDGQSFQNGLPESRFQSRRKSLSLFDTADLSRRMGNMTSANESYLLNIIQQASVSLSASEFLEFAQQVSGVRIRGSRPKLAEILRNMISRLRVSHDQVSRI